MNAAAIMAALGGHKAGSTYMCRCPTHRDGTASLAVRDTGDGRVIVKCHAQCAQETVIGELKRRGLWPDAPSSRATARAPPISDDARRIAYARELWSEGRNPFGTLAERYLVEQRKLQLDDDLAMRVVRFHPQCPWKDTAGNSIRVPALLLAFRPLRNDDEDELPRAIHRIGLTPHGLKIDKRMLGPVAGCAIKVDADDMVEEGLGICEGFETGLAVRQRKQWRPIWALGNAGAVRDFPVLPGVEHLTVFADHDETGLRAARACCRRWSEEGHDAEMVHRSTWGMDYAD